MYDKKPKYSNEYFAKVDPNSPTISLLLKKVAYSKYTKTNNTISEIIFLAILYPLF